ncbi:molybdopterin molybdotransferase MoeA [Marinomonas sp. M1K-6]|uniref:Molybdopterin molybdenumtransferase n=1 Tax=Marinomonas profundi TaxID=2726122 RepID=A0A847R6Q9_9GAMM|nr:molybdopterin molybdotransferase MoeA [Marinomonas profundi]NLQ18173.1 molybdopterin molybdotransferase MoeA [Marinomonas profundi]UDV03529.1 molybdopterin molybdotransferase MoeA [Marinomonas profundi]
MSTLLAFEDALEEIKRSASVRVEQQTIPLITAVGRILAMDVIAGLSVPPHDNSAMDGYAIACTDWQTGKPFTVSQRIAAGQHPQPLTPGTCARIFTGANIPNGANTVIMQENAQLSGEKVVFNEPPEQGDNIRPKGQDVQKGQTVINAGEKITPMHIGLLSSLGVTDVTVYKPLKVGILTTGDELIPAGENLKAGQIYNSNGPMLSALVIQAGHHVSHCIHAADTLEDTKAALKTLTQSCDVILSSGGVSVGEEDHVKGALEQLGKVHLWKIAIKPGKPLVHATLQGVPFLGLPGNPSSTLVTYHWFARLLLAICSGQIAERPQSYLVDAGFNGGKAIQRDEFLRVSIGKDGLAYAHSQQSSGALLAACESQGYLHVKANTQVEYGCAYSFYPFSGF